MHELHSLRRLRRFFVLTALIGMLMLTACSGADGRTIGQAPSHGTEQTPSQQADADEMDNPAQDAGEPAQDPVEPTTDAGQDEHEGTPPEEPALQEDEHAGREADELEAIRASYDITDPSSIAVLVNKTYGLPEDYEPDDLVKVDIPFVYQDDSVHSLRQVAADALVEMFAAAKEDGIELAGVSGYRSYAIQKMLYEKYAARDGQEAADKYSARPGHSEHMTGLAMDVAELSGRCAARNCFADTEEAKWLAEHAHEFGFIIRYPLGKEEITGYQYEPWHLRYVGVELAQILYENDWTMEEFFLPESVNTVNMNG